MMRFLFAGGEGFFRTPQEEMAFDLARALAHLNHDTQMFDPLSPPLLQDVDLLVAFVDELSPTLVHCMQDAIEAGVQILCVTDGRKEITSDFLVSAGRSLGLQLTHYRDYDDLCARVFLYVNTMILRRRAVIAANAN